MAHTGILKRLLSDKGYCFIHSESEQAGRLRVQDASQDVLRARPCASRQHPTYANVGGTSLQKARRHVLHRLAPGTQGDAVPILCRLGRTSAQLSNVAVMPLATRLVPAISLEEALTDPHTVVKVDVEGSEFQLLSKPRNWKNTRLLIFEFGRPKPTLCPAGLRGSSGCPASWQFTHLHLEAEMSRRKTRETWRRTWTSWRSFAYRRIPGIDHTLLSFCASPPKKECLRLLRDLPGRLRKLGAAAINEPPAQILGANGSVFLDLCDRKSEDMASL